MDITYIMSATYLVGPIVTVGLLAIFYFKKPTFFYDHSEFWKDGKIRSSTKHPVLPNGWLSVFESSCLSRNQAIYVVIHGSQYRLTRDKDGILHCQKIDDINRNTAVDTFETCGFILIWLHAEGMKPNWYPPATSNEYDENTWKHSGRSEDLINCLMQDIPENGADNGHVDIVHGPSFFFGWGILSQGLQFLRWAIGNTIWNTHWQGPIEEDTPHVSYIKSDVIIRMFGIQVFDMQLRIRQYGPSFNFVHFTIYGGSIPGMLIQSVMPVDANKQRVVHYMYMDDNKILGFILPWFIMWAFTRHFRRDAILFNTKAFHKSPK